MTDPDLPLWMAVVEGDHGAFAELVRRHEGRLFNLAYRMLGDPEEAREATQDVFLKAFRNAARFKPKGKVYTWLYRIAMNLCLNRLRRRKIVRFFSLAEAGTGGDRSGEPIELDPADHRPDAEADLRTRRRWKTVRRSIDELPTSQRQVLILAKFEGLSYREISEILGITLGAVESRLVRAMRRLNQAQEKAD